MLLLAPKLLQCSHSPVQVFFDVLIHARRQRVPQTHVGEQLRLSGRKVDVLQCGGVVLGNVQDQVLQVVCGRGGEGKGYGGTGVRAREQGDAYQWEAGEVKPEQGKEAKHS
jgi:hypothetical protein